MWFYDVKKILIIMLLLCPLATSCAKSKQSDANVVENQNNLLEIEHRIANLEERVATINTNVQESNSRVYDVHNKAGRPTGWTARPKPTPKSAPATPPVAHVSPISGSQNISAQPMTPMQTSTAQAPVTPVIANPQPTAMPASSQTLSARAPMGTLDPTTRMQGVPMVENKANSSHALSLPPESALYPPTQGVASANINQTNTATNSAAPQQVVVPQAPIAQTTTPQAPAVQAVAVAPAAPATPPARALSGEQSAYKTALDLVLAGQYVQGREQFNTFLQQYPSGRLAPNAYYWIGESFYAQKNYPDALLSFKQVTTTYPKHHKTPDALLKAGMTYEKLGDNDNASLQYQALLNDFPSSNAAKIARNKR